MEAVHSGQGLGNVSPVCQVPQFVFIVLVPQAVCKLLEGKNTSYSLDFSLNVLIL